MFRLSRVVGDARRGRRARRRTTSRRASTCARPPVGWHRRPSVVEATLLLRKGAGPRCGGVRPSVEHDVSGPDTDSPWDRVGAAHATGWPTSCWRSAPTSSSSRRPSCATTSSSRLARRGRGPPDAACRASQCRRAPRTRSPGCSRWCPTSTPTREVRLDEAAAAVGSTPEQVVKDLERAVHVRAARRLPRRPDRRRPRRAGGPEEGGLRLEGVIRVSNADYLARPLRLTPTEATAIIVALRALRGTAPATTPARSSTARWPSSRRPPGRPRRGSRRWSSPGEDDDAEATRLRASLEDAVARRRQVRLTYYVPARDEESERVVDPRGVVTSGGVAYLDAWCHSAEAPRLFRLDRIHEAEVLDSPVETAPEPPRDLSDGLFQRVPGDHPGDPAPPAAGPLGGRSTTRSSRSRPGPDGTVEVDMRVADQRWLLRLLMRLAPYARVRLTARAGRRVPGDGTANSQPVPVRRPDQSGVDSAPNNTDVRNCDDCSPRSPASAPPRSLLILAVLVLLFGASKLPELARGSGRALRIFKAETKGLMDDDDDDVRPTAKGDNAQRSPEQRELQTRPAVPRRRDRAPGRRASSRGAPRRRPRLTERE